MPDSPKNQEGFESKQDLDEAAAFGDTHWKQGDDDPEFVVPLAPAVAASPASSRKPGTQGLKMTREL
ncbi:hypothetical protein [Bryobacter aggregatus]|uniref:hypothetical protein n=1 Tax=Bryobacter aggregatus TaxID=360054 RepID=UPI0004E18C67|nr:hypothetical protein [Bryobacter aggregatus]